MPANRNVAANPKPAPKLSPLRVKSPVSPGTPGYGVLATPVVPKGQINLRTQPTAPIAHQSGPKSTPETHTTTGRERPGTSSDNVITKAEHGQQITAADQAKAVEAQKLLAQKIKINSPKIKIDPEDAAFKLATIRADAATARRVASLSGTLLGRAALDAVHAPAAGVTFGLDLGKSAVDDIAARAGLHGFEAQREITAHPENSQLAKMADQATLPYQQAVGLKGGPKALLAEAKAHPANIALSFAPLVGAPFRAAGAAARTGALGETAADFASTQRAPAVLIKGGSGGRDLTAENTDAYSKNLAIKHLIQRPIERNERAQSAILRLKALTRKGDSTHHAIETHLNQMYSADRSRRMHREAEGVKQMIQARPKLDEAAEVVAHGMIGRLPEGHEVAGLNAIKAKLENAASLAGTKDSPFKDDEAFAYNQQQLKDINTILASPHLDEAIAQIKAFLPEQHARQSMLDSEAVSRGILAPSEAERRPLLSYAIEQMGARKAADKDHSIMWHTVRQANKDVERAMKNVQEIKDAQRIPPRAAKISAEIAQQARRRTELMRQATGLRAKADTLQRAENAAKDAPTATRFRNQRLAAEAKYQDVAQELDAVHQDVLNKRISRNQIKRASRDSLKQDRLNAEGVLEEARQRQNDAASGQRERLKGFVHQVGTTAAGKPVMKELSTEDILAHMEKNGVHHVSYLSAKLPKDERIARLSGAYAGGDNGTYTGAGLTPGAFDAGYGNVAHTYLRSIQKLEQARFFNSLHDEFGLGRHLSHADAMKLAQDVEDRSGHRMVLLHDKIQALSKDQALALEKEHGVSATKDAGKFAHDRANAEMQAQIADRAAAYHPDSQFSVVPAHMISHLKALQQADETHGWLDLADAFTRRFRNTVLPYSTKWLTGNVAEGGLRLALESHGNLPAIAGGYRFAKKNLAALKEANPEAYRELSSYTTTGLHMSFADRALLEESVRKEGEMQALIDQQGKVGHSLNERNPERFRQDSQAAHVMMRYARKLITPHDKLRQTVYHLNSQFEKSAELAALGMHMKQDMHQFSHGWIRANDKMEDWYNEFLNGRYDAAKAREAGRYIHKVLGQYDAFGPGTKRFIRSVAPFAAWYLNSIRFIYMTMPRDHPLVTGAVAASSINPAITNNVNPDSKVVPGDEFVNGMPIGDLPEALKTGPDAYLDLARYTPAGAFEEGPAGTIKDMVLPQYSDIIQALGGKDPFLTDLKNADGSATNGWENLQVALNDILKDVGGPAQPLFNVLVGRGRTQANAGTFWKPQFKPGTEGSPVLGSSNGIVEGLNRQFNPGRSIQLNPHGAKPAPNIGQWGSVLSTARDQLAQNKQATSNWNALLGKK